MVLALVAAAEGIGAPLTLHGRPFLLRVQPFSTIVRPTVKRHKLALPDGLPFFLAGGDLLVRLEEALAAHLVHEPLQQGAVAWPVAATGAAFASDRIPAPRDPGSSARAHGAHERLHLRRHETGLHRAASVVLLRLQRRRGRRWLSQQRRIRRPDGAREQEAAAHEVFRAAEKLFRPVGIR